MTSTDDDPAPPDTLSDELIRELEPLDRGELESVLSYVERRIDALRTPLEAEIEASATGEVLEVKNHGAYALVRKHPPKTDGSGVNRDVVSLYHVQREPTPDGTDTLHWMYLGDIRGSRHLRCRTCGGALDQDASVCPHCGRTDIDTAATEE